MAMGVHLLYGAWHAIGIYRTRPKKAYVCEQDNDTDLKTLTQNTSHFYVSPPIPKMQAAAGAGLTQTAKKCLKIHLRKLDWKANSDIDHYDFTNGTQMAWRAICVYHVALYARQPAIHQPPALKF